MMETDLLVSIYNTRRKLQEEARATSKSFLECVDLQFMF